METVPGVAGAGGPGHAMQVQAVPNVDQVWQVQNQIAERRPLAET